LALLYAIEHPEQVERLALISPAPAWREARQEFERRFQQRNLDPALQTARAALRESGLRDRDPQVYARRVFELSVAPYFYNPDRARSLTPFRVTGRTQQEVWQSLGDYDLRPRLSGLSLRAVVLQGRDDVIPEESARTLAQLLGADLHLLSNCGHVPYVEALEDFTGLLDEFLPRLGRQQPQQH
jgi:proline iminopeptidase